MPLGESPFEKQLLEIVEAALEEHDMAFEGQANGNGNGNGGHDKEKEKG